MNGSMFVSHEAIVKEELDREALSSVKITEHPEEGDDTERQIENGICDTVLHWEEGYLFNIREETDDERKYRTIQERYNLLTEAMLELSEIIYQ